MTVGSSAFRSDIGDSIVMHVLTVKRLNPPMSYRATTASWSFPSPPNDNFLLDGLEGPVETLSPSAAAVHPSSRVQLLDVKPIASYSWIDEEGTTPYVVVPGEPS